MTSSTGGVVPRLAPAPPPPPAVSTLRQGRSWLAHRGCLCAPAHASAGERPFCSESFRGVPARRPIHSPAAHERVRLARHTDGHNGRPLCTWAVLSSCHVEIGTRASPQELQWRRRSRGGPQRCMGAPTSTARPPEMPARVVRINHPAGSAGALRAPVTPPSVPASAYLRHAPPLCHRDAPAVDARHAGGRP